MCVYIYRCYPLSLACISSTLPTPMVILSGSPSLDDIEANDGGVSHEREGG